MATDARERACVLSLTNVVEAKRGHRWTQNKLIQIRDAQHVHQKLNLVDEINARGIFCHHTD